MSIQNLNYIANIRLPTEKAHGFQICKMCEAFARHETAVTLYHPHRHQPQELQGLQGESAFDYYGISHTFNIQTVPIRIDFLRFENKIPKKILRQLLKWREQYFANICQKIAILNSNHHAFFYTRDVQVARVLTATNQTTIFEAHSIPKGNSAKALQQTLKSPYLKKAVVLTHFIKDDLINMGLAPEKVLIEPDAVDLNPYNNLPNTREAKKELGLPMERPIIGYIGRFKTMGMDKGIHFLLQMMSHLPQTLSAEPLLLCVGGPMEDVPHYYKLAKEFGVPNGRLKFIDRVPNKAVPKWISAIDIATMPYPFTEHYAYFMSPMKLFEYLAAGKAIVSTNLPAIQEILVDGKNGRFAPHDNPKAFADLIGELLNDPLQKTKLEKQAKKDAKKYTWSARAQRILESIDG